MSEVWEYWWNKPGRMHNRSENGRGACVTLCAQPTHTDTVVDKVGLRQGFL
jgi:hypothetical protein